jgi:hypothetical protein
VAALLTMIPIVSTSPNTQLEDWLIRYSNW